MAIYYLYIRVRRLFPGKNLLLDSTQMKSRTKGIPWPIVGPLDISINANPPLQRRPWSSGTAKRYSILAIRSFFAIVFAGVSIVLGNENTTLQAENCLLTRVHITDETITIEFNGTWTSTNTKVQFPKTEKNGVVVLRGKNSETVAWQNLGNTVQSQLNQTAMIKIEVEGAWNLRGGIPAIHVPPSTLMITPSAAKEISFNRVLRILDFASSGGYSRNDWRAMQQEIRAIPDTQFDQTAKEVIASGRRLDIPPVLDELCFVWSQKDPEAVLAFAESIPEKSLREFCYSAAFGGWVEHDWKSARAWLNKLPGSTLHDRMATGLIEKVAVHDPRAALQVLAEEFLQGKRPDTWHIMAICARRDPAAAVKSLESLPQCSQKNSGRGALARYWAEDQPELAWKWASGLTVEQERTRAQKDAIIGAASVDPEKAARVVEQSPEPLRSELLNVIAFQWAEKDAEAAAKWASTLPNDEQAAVFVTIFSRSNITNPQAFLEPMLSLPAGRDRNLAITRILQRMSDEKFDEVRQWLIKQPQGPDSGLFLTSLSKVLADKDPELLVSLFAKMPEGKDKASMLGTLKTVIQEVRPDLASRLVPVK